MIQHVSRILTVFVIVMLAVTWPAAKSAETNDKLRVAIEPKLFFVDPGTQKANISIKVTIQGSPDSGVVHFNVQGTDEDDFVLADLFMHGMRITRGAPSTCTKRFEVDRNDFARIRRWRLADIAALDVAGFYTDVSVMVKSIPESDNSTIGTLLFRVKCQFTGNDTIPDFVAIQGLDDEGYEVCHFMFDEYDCTHDSSFTSRRGRWLVAESRMELDGFKQVFRPKDFEDIPRLKTWRVLSFQRDKSNLYGVTTWNGDLP